jgi:hypothetical protein
MTFDLPTTRNIAIRDVALAKVQRLYKAWTACSRASGELRESHMWADTATEHAVMVEALETMTIVGRRMLYNDVTEVASQLGFLLAQEITDQIRSESNNDIPVIPLTGNSMMPPIRCYDIAETVYNLSSHEDAFTVMVERMESTLTENGVIIDCPDYDNALWGVDTNRWEYVGDQDDDPNAWLAAESWQRKENN